MEEETSDRKNGCVPIFTNDCQELLSILINKEKNEILFGFNTVILVRNKESKKKIPSNLTDLLCLTIYESKVNNSKFFFFNYNFIFIK